jgi:hypothetical protein
MKTMTLKMVRDSLVHAVSYNAPTIARFYSAIDAAILERDELKADNERMQILLRGSIHAGGDFVARAEKAEAELAALRKRVDDAPTGTLLVNYSHGQPISANIAADDGEALAAIDQCSVRLVVDDA